MKAVVVAGGRGERLRPLTNTIPKPMIKIGDFTLLEHTILLLKKHKVTNIILALCYLPHVIQNHFGNGSKFGIKIEYIFEDPEYPRGTAGAILPAHKYIDKTFIVTYADVLRELDITKMIKFHKKSKSLATINSYKHSGSNFKSSIEFNKDNTLIKFSELKKSKMLKKGFRWSNGSFYIFEPEIFKYIRQHKIIDFSRDIFPKLIKEKKKVSVFTSDGIFIDIGTHENLKKAKKIITNKNKKKDTK